MYLISGKIFGLVSSFVSNRRLRVVLDRKSSQEYPVNAGVPQGSTQLVSFDWSNNNGSIDVKMDGFILEEI